MFHWSNAPHFPSILGWRDDIDLCRHPDSKLVSLFSAADHSLSQLFIETRFNAQDKPYIREARWLKPALMNHALSFSFRLNE